MRTIATFALGTVIALGLPASLQAQRQGAVEIGGFGRLTKFGESQQLDAAFGGGGRAGVYVLKNLLLEMDVSYANANVNRPSTGIAVYDSLNRVSHTLWNYRLLYNAALTDKTKLLVGGGYAYDAYGRQRQVAPRGGGASGLLGLRFALNDMLSVRLEGTANMVGADDATNPTARESHVNIGGQAGVSIALFTSPSRPRVDTVIERIVQRDTVITRRLDTVRVEVPGRPVVIGAVQFAFNRDAITEEARKVLDQIAASLVESVNTSRTINVQGNTDAIGSEASNTRLGQQRADQVRDYLVSKGVAASRITTSTAGESNPLAPNNTDNGRATNRRVLITLSN
jgi:outer membrane protein OmpA-like peptidoglycan-associated protein